MATISMDQIKELRDKTGISIMQCRKALEDANGNMEKAMVLLAKKGAETAAKKAERVLKSGRIASYLHGAGTVGVLVELWSESDFVSRHEDFGKLAYDIAMQIAAANPTYGKREDVPEDEKVKITDAFADEVKGKPDAIREKILNGKLDAFFKEKILLEQDFIKDPSVTIRNLIESAIQKFGEKIEIGRFVRFSTMK
ncbi:MAG: elongation factor Ts [Patescibacteria group bacterium]|nr:elongation factor Ts [Patescibacteria group bacterium]MDE1946126.1 elongation factor Ts [Patescibacteria group bacterium]